ncbi:hypothetical protein ACKKBG_A37190 [Auxenochlorella protothecoides x Auxenochlorella symbiontica]
MAGPSAAEVDKLIAGSNEALKKLKSINADPSLDLAITNDIESHTKAIKRIEELQRAKAGATSQVRLVRYFQKHGNGIFWIATTGLLFGMAWNRLQEKYEQEAFMKEVEEERQKLRAKADRLEEQVRHLTARQQLVLEQAETSSSFGGSGLAKKIREILLKAEQNSGQQPSAGDVTGSRVQQKQYKSMF